MILVGFAWILLGFRAVKTGGALGLRLCYIGFYLDFGDIGAVAVSRRLRSTSGNGGGVVDIWALFCAVVGDCKLIVPR